MPKLIDTSYDNQYFYSWSSYGRNWAAGSTVYDTDFPSTLAPGAGSLAISILRNTFDLTVGSTGGSNIDGYDIVNKDAYEMIQLSLAGEMVNNQLLECYADENGVVQFYEIGRQTISPDALDTLYFIKQTELKKRCDTVLVYGYDPPQKRYVGNRVNVLTMRGPIFDDEFGPADNTESLPKAWPIGDYLPIEACPGANYREGYLEYSDGFIRATSDSDMFTYSNLETVDGFLYEVTVPFYEPGRTRVEFRQRTTRYVTLDGFGQLQSRSWRSDQDYVPAGCDVGDDGVGGVRVPNSDHGKFSGVSGVYIIGYKINQLELCEVYAPGENSPSNGGATFWADVVTLSDEPHRLSEGEDYIVIGNISQGFSIVFSANVSPKHLSKYGGSLSGGNITFKIPASSLFLGEDGTLRLKDGSIVSEDTIYSAPIFPTGDGVGGYAVSSIVVAYEWDNPCVAVFDTVGGVTEENLKRIEVYARPMKISDRPQYMAYNGIDIPATWQLDTSPNNRYQQIINSMENSDIRLTIPYLDQYGCRSVSANVLALQRQTAYMCTYTCGPKATPKLGQRVVNGDGNVGDGIINSIEYSYQDGSQYLISVQTGPIWQGMSSWDNATQNNQTERKQVEGIIRYVGASNVKCTVYVPGMGLVDCVNGQMQLLNEGDVVKVTVQNEPVR